MPAARRGARARWASQSAWLDGEIVVHRRRGVPDFNALQNAIDDGAQRRDRLLPLRRAVPRRPRPAPGAARVAPAAAAGLLDGPRPTSACASAPTFDADAGADAARPRARMSSKGIIAKRADAPYVVAGAPRPGSSSSASCARSSSSCGFTDRAGAPREVGSLLLGVPRRRGAGYVGNVGTGWDARRGTTLHARLSKLEVAEAAVRRAAPRSRAAGRGAPPAASAGSSRELVAEVAFREWTPDGHVRHAVFQGLRTDKPARAVAREAPATTGATSAAVQRHREARRRIKVTQPRARDRPVDRPDQARPGALLRERRRVDPAAPRGPARSRWCARPTGVAGELFFQKHPEKQHAGPHASSTRAVARPRAAARGRQRRRRCSPRRR